MGFFSEGQQGKATKRERRTTEATRTMGLPERQLVAPTMATRTPKRGEQGEPLATGRKQWAQERGYTEISGAKQKWKPRGKRGETKKKGAVGTGIFHLSKIIFDEEELKLLDLRPILTSKNMLGNSILKNYIQIGGGVV